MGLLEGLRIWGLLRGLIATLSTTRMGRTTLGRQRRRNSCGAWGALLGRKVRATARNLIRSGRYSRGQLDRGFGGTRRVVLGTRGRGGGAVGAFGARIAIEQRGGIQRRSPSSPISGRGRATIVAGIHCRGKKSNRPGARIAPQLNPAFVQRTPPPCSGAAPPRGWGECNEDAYPLSPVR